MRDGFPRKLHTRFSCTAGQLRALMRAAEPRKEVYLRASGTTLGEGQPLGNKLDFQLLSSFVQIVRIHYHPLDLHVYLEILYMINSYLYYF